MLCKAGTRIDGIVTGMDPNIWKGLFLKKKDIWREQSTEIRRCDHLNNPGKGGIVSEKVILLFIGYDLGMVGVKVVSWSLTWLLTLPYIPQLHHIFIFKTASSLHQCFLYFFWSSLRRRADERKISDAARGLMVPAFSDFSAHFVRWMMTCKTFTSVSPNLQPIICGVREKISMIKIFLVLKCVIWYHS